MFSTRRVDRHGEGRDRIDGIGGELERQAFGRHQRHILLDQARLGLGQDAAEVVLGERMELDADRQAALQLRQEVGGLGDMEGARGDEQDVIGFHLAVLGGNGGALDQRQEIALHALAADVGAITAFARADLVDLVEEDDAVVLDRSDRLLDQFIVVEQLVGFLVDQDVVRNPSP